MRGIVLYNYYIRSMEMMCHSQNELIEAEFIDDRTATQRHDWEIAQ